MDYEFNYIKIVGNIFCIYLTKTKSKTQILFMIKIVSFKLLQKNLCLNLPKDLLNERKQ